MVIKMGCSSSYPDPNLMYGKRATAENNNIDDKIVQNGHIRIRKTEKDKKEEMNTTIKGDLNQWNEAKIQRSQGLKERQAKREKKAEIISEKVMEEKELLSLVSSRSRMTSRATSRSGSPTHSKVNGFICSRKSSTGTETAHSPIQEVNENVISDQCKDDVKSNESNNSKSANDLHHLKSADSMEARSKDTENPVQKPAMKQDETGAGVKDGSATDQEEVSSNTSTNDSRSQAKNVRFSDTENVKNKKSFTPTPH